MGKIYLITFLTEKTNAKGFNLFETDHLSINSSVYQTNVDCIVINIECKCWSTYSKEYSTRKTRRKKNRELEDNPVLFAGL